MIRCGSLVTCLRYWSSSMSFLRAASNCLDMAFSRMAISCQACFARRGIASQLLALFRHRELRRAHNTKNIVQAPKFPVKPLGIENRCAYLDMPSFSSHAISRIEGPVPVYRQAAEQVSLLMRRCSRPMQSVCSNGVNSAGIRRSAERRLRNPKRGVL